MYATFAAQGTALLTACLPDPGAMLRLPGLLAHPLARRQRSVNAVVHALSERYDALHVHLTERQWLADRAMWSADRLHPGERGHRLLAVRVHRLLADAGLAAGAPPAGEPELPPPSRGTKVRWLATEGTAWVLRRSTDLLPQLLVLAGREAAHRACGTSARLDAQAAVATAEALATAGAASPAAPPTGTPVAALPLASAAAVAALGVGAAPGLTPPGSARRGRR